MAFPTRKEFLRLLLCLLLHRYHKFKRLAVILPPLARFFYIGGQILQCFNVSVELIIGLTSVIEKGVRHFNLKGIEFFKIAERLVVIFRLKGIGEG